MIIIIIIIIIMSCRQHGYPWPSLAISPYHSSPPAGLQGYILCLHIAAVCKFELVVLLLLGHMWGSIGAHHLRARPCFSSCVLVSGSFNLYSFRDGRQVTVQLVSHGVLSPGLVQYCSQHSCVVAVSWGVVVRTCLIVLSTFLCNFRLVSSPAASLASM